MEAKGLLVRGSMVMDVNDVGSQPNIRQVATWHIPETFSRDMKLLQALPFITEVKCQEVTGRTPKKHIKPLFGGLKAELATAGWSSHWLTGWTGKRLVSNCPVGLRIINPHKVYCHK